MNEIVKHYWLRVGVSAAPNIFDHEPDSSRWRVGQVVHVVDAAAYENALKTIEHLKGIVDSYTADAKLDTDPAEHQNPPLATDEPKPEPKGEAGGDPEGPEAA